MYPIRGLTLLTLCQLTSLVLSQDITNDPAFFGFTQGSNDIYTANVCNTGLIWSTYRDFGGCMDPTDAASTQVVLDCNLGTFSFAGSTLACTDAYETSTQGSAIWNQCASFVVADDSTDTDLITRYYCSNTPRADLFTLTLPAGATYVDESSETTTIPGGSTSTPSPSPSRSASVPGPTSTDPGPAVPGGRRSKSKAWIAGAVIGPLVGLALVIAGSFLCLKRRRNKTSGGTTNLAYAPQPGPHAGGAMAQTPSTQNPTNSYYGQSPASPYQPPYSPPPQATSPIKTGYQESPTTYPSSPLPQYTSPQPQQQQYQQPFVTSNEKPTVYYASPPNAEVSELGDGSGTARPNH